MATNKRLVPHENLLYDVILRQAGTLSKAILEGVMNSVDAGGTRIDVTLSANQIVISDDGVGFKNEKEIDEWFAQFGTPHEVDEHDNSVDARYGRFRMGRGQLFAFGSNTWQTNKFKMDVDIKNKGLDFVVNEYKKDQHRGCKVTVNLYDSLAAFELLQTEKEIMKFCKYVDVDLYLNGTQINSDPTTLTWDYETDDGYIQVISSGEGNTNSYRAGRGVDIYQQGVFVETVSQYDVGVGGVLVTKLPLKLNFARNSVMRSTCPRWKRMYALLKESGVKEVRKKTNLNTSERAAMIDQLRSGELYYHNACSMRLFLDAQGKTWSSGQIKNAYGSKSRFILSPAKKLLVTFSKVNDRIGDKVMQENKALVLDECLLEQWECEPDEFIEDVLKQFEYSHKYNMEYQPLNKIDTNKDVSCQVIDDKDLTPRQRMVLGILNNTSWYMWRAFYRVNEHRGHRIIRAGKSNYARAWTDGSTYVAINIEEIKSRISTMTIGKWGELLNLLLHEFCHAEPDTESHLHDAHFFQLFHDTSESIMDMAEQAHRAYLKRLIHESKKNKLPQKLQLQVLKEAERIQAELAVDLVAEEALIKAKAKELTEVAPPKAKKKVAKKKVAKK